MGRGGRGSGGGLGNMASGVLGHIGIGAGVTCNADDDSFFCQLTKFTSMISQFVLIIVIFSLVYFVFSRFVMPYFFKGNKTKRR
jgi:hypothetical protein